MKAVRKVKLTHMRASGDPCLGSGVQLTDLAVLTNFWRCPRTSVLLRNSGFHSGVGLMTLFALIRPPASLRAWPAPFLPRSESCGALPALFFRHSDWLVLLLEVWPHLIGPCSWAYGVTQRIRRAGPHVSGRLPPGGARGSTVESAAAAEER